MAANDGRTNRGEDGDRGGARAFRQSRGDGPYDDFDDTSTASHREEQGLPQRRTVNERMRNVPITFGSDGSGGIVGGGPAPHDDEHGPDPEAEANQRAVEEGARRLERERGV